MPWLRVSHQAAFEVLARAAVISRFHWDRNHSKLIHWLLETNASSLSHGFLCRIGYYMTAGFPQCEHEKAREGFEDSCDNFYNLILKWHPITCTILVFIISKSLGPVHMVRELQKGVNTKRWGVFGGYVRACLPQHLINICVEVNMLIFLYGQIEQKGFGFHGKTCLCANLN